MRPAKSVIFMGKKETLVDPGKEFRFESTLTTENNFLLATVREDCCSSFQIKNVNGRTEIVMYLTIEINVR